MDELDQDRYHKDGDRKLIHVPHQFKIETG